MADRSLLRVRRSPDGGETHLQRGDLPAGSTTALSIARMRIPEFPHFFGPGTRSLAAARQAFPFLMGGWLVALAGQGVLSAPLCAIAAGTALTLAGASEMWLRLRRRALLGCASDIHAFAEIALGPDHELTGRARRSAERIRDLSGDWTEAVTDVEEGLRYTWELITR